MKIAFVCTGNSCRSQMAEGFARHYAKEGIEVYSAGITATEVNPRTVLVMKEIGIDISKQWSKNIDALPKDLDHVVTVCGHAAKLCPQLKAKKEINHWNIDDPKMQGSDEEILADFRRIREILRDRVYVFLQGRNLLKP